MRPRAAAVHGLGDPERRALEPLVGGAHASSRSPPPSSSLRSATQSSRTSSSTAGVEQIGVALERLLGRVDERLGLVAQLGELAAEGVGSLGTLALGDEAVDLVGATGRWSA